MSDDTISDSVLIERIRSDDSSAFKSLFNLYADLLLRFVYRYIHDPQICEDIVQEIFVKIWIKRKNLQSISSIKSYLYTAVRNSAFQHLRHEHYFDEHRCPRDEPGHGSLRPGRQGLAITDVGSCGLDRFQAARRSSGDGIHLLHPGTRLGRRELDT